jgi:hypothetical protein
VIRALAHRDAVHRRLRLDAGGRIHYVSGHHPLAQLRPSVERDNRLTRVHTDADRQRQPRTGLVQLRQRLQDRQPGPHRPLRIVLVSNGGAEHGHNRVPDELLHRPPERLGPFAHAPMIGSNPRLHLLRIHRLRRRREPDQIAEQHRHNLPLRTLSDAGSGRGRLVRSGFRAGRRACAGSP